MQLEAVPAAPAVSVADPSTECHHPKHHRKSSEKETHPHSHRHHHRHRSSSNKRHSSRPAKPRPLPPPSQFVIEKQGRFEEDLWHTRILTLDAPHHRLYLSKANKAEELHHRCMVRIDAVKLWPTFNSLRIGEPFHSGEAKRTVCIKGLVGVKPSTLSFATRLFGPSTNTVPSTSLIGRFFTNRRARQAEQDEITAAQTGAAKHRDPQLQPAPSNGSFSDSTDIGDFGEFATEVWMIRVMTQDDVRLLARALRRTLTDTNVLTGFRRTMESAAPSADGET